MHWRAGRPRGVGRRRTPWRETGEVRPINVIHGEFIENKHANQTAFFDVEQWVMRGFAASRTERSDLERQSAWRLPTRVRVQVPPSAPTHPASRPTSPDVRTDRVRSSCTSRHR